jgi:hypothetical protein
MEEMSSIYLKLPVPESVKKRFTDHILKNKSAWYACLVNSNIDVLLLPEYIESRQNRNILIKKETDQYFKSLDGFSLLSGKSNASLYECILVSDDAPQSPGIDLFSGSTVKNEGCPETLHKIFENWNQTLSGYSKLESLVYAVLEWHAANQYTFSGNRQVILWFNYQLVKQFGQPALTLNLENYLFHHWQKENLEIENAIKGLINFIQSEIAKNTSLLNTIYKEHIDFAALKPGQKLVSGYLFSIGFNIQLPAHIHPLPVIKTLLKKGYVEIHDLGQKADMEKIRMTLEELFSIQRIMMVNEDGYLYISLNPSYRSGSGRLDAYTNIERLAPEVNWEGFVSQPVTKTIMPKAAKITIEPETVAPVKRRQKAFFG